MIEGGCRGSEMHAAVVAMRTALTELARQSARFPGTPSEPDDPRRESVIGQPEDASQPLGEPCQSLPQHIEVPNRLRFQQRAGGQDALRVVLRLAPDGRPAEWRAGHAPRAAQMLLQERVEPPADAIARVQVQREQHCQRTNSARTPCFTRSPAFPMSYGKVIGIQPGSPLSGASLTGHVEVRSVSGKSFTQQGLQGHLGRLQAAHRRGRRLYCRSRL